MERIELAHGRITRAHSITVVLTEPDNDLPAVHIVWPEQASITTPEQLQAVAVKATNVLARATIRLAQIKRERKR
jgi:hypothetical protein